LEKAKEASKAGQKDEKIRLLEEAYSIGCVCLSFPHRQLFEWAFKVRKLIL